MGCQTLCARAEGFREASRLRAGARAHGRRARVVTARAFGSAPFRRAQIQGVHAKEGPRALVPALMHDLTLHSAAGFAQPGKARQACCIQAAECCAILETAKRVVFVVVMA